MVCEGIATAATVREATGFAAVVAFDAGNVLSVAETIRAKYPSDQIIIAGDNDAGTICPRHKQEGAPAPLDPRGKRPEWCRCNPGTTAAMKAAAAIGGLAAVPKFAPGTDGEGFTDWNDFGSLYGLEAVASESAPRASRATAGQPQGPYGSEPVGPRKPVGGLQAGDTSGRAGGSVRPSRRGKIVLCACLGSFGSLAKPTRRIRRARAGRHPTQCPAMLALLPGYQRAELKSLPDLPS